MGKALRGDAEARRGRWRAGKERLALLLALLLAPAAVVAQRGVPERVDGGRFTFVAYPSDLPLAHRLLDAARAHDSFPGLARPVDHALIAIAPDARRFREWTGSGAPDWGAAIAIPDQHRIVMQGSGAGSGAGDPRAVLRHELAHLALHEQMGALPPRWFDEGYAGYVAGEWGREEVLAANVGLVLHGIPASLDSLEDDFHGGASRASSAYALAYRAVNDLSALDEQRGLSLFFVYWKQSGSMDVAMRHAYGVTLSGFEAQWRSRTIRRYGALAVVANLSLLFAVFALLLVPLTFVRRRRDTRRMQQLRVAEEASERASRESALDALLAAALAPSDPPQPPAGTRPASADGDG